MGREEKRADGLKGKTLTKLIQVKDAFLHICKQYDHMGSLIRLQAKSMKHPIFSKTTAPACHQRIIEQYQEMGEQLKDIGRGLDDMGGKPVLENLKEKKINELKEMKKLDEDEEPEIEIKDGFAKNKTFVSNIQPKKATDEELQIKSERNGYGPNDANETYITDEELENEK